ncbi:hypothetical protein CRYUN_Cryun03dG0175900 [Craigia yunnanensis]
MDAQVSSFEFSTSSVSTEDFSDISSSTLLSSTLYGSETYSSPFLGNNLPGILPGEQYLSRVGEGDTPSNDQFMLDGVENFLEWMASDSSISSQQIFTEDASSQNISPISGEVSLDVPSVQASLVLLLAYMEVDDQLVILHLLKACGDAMGSEQMELAEEIIRRIKEKASTTGKSLERLAFYLTVVLDKQANYLMQESSKNYEAAFKAFYQIFPYGRFAHFTANSAILEAIPANAMVVHIVDFEIGRGIQWLPLIEAFGRKGLRMLWLTSIKWGEEDGSCSPTTFEETKKQLCGQAMNFGLRLKVEEMDIEGLVNEINKEWEETTMECGSLRELGLEPQRISWENYLEARELVKEGERFILGEN